MFRPTTFAIVATLGIAATPAAALTNSQWSDAGTAVTIGLVAGGYGLTAVKDDWQGTKSLTFALVGSGATSWVLKQAIVEERPDGSGNDSFPSGHATIAFASAGFMQARYGWKIGLPATVAAAFVGFTRVQADKHYWWDVVAGAAIGEVWAWVLTKPLNDNIEVVPWGGTKGGGVSINATF
jgi:membrane-associated phospholipid phosphatase